MHTHAHCQCTPLHTHDAHCQCTQINAHPCTQWFNLSMQTLTLKSWLKRRTQKRDYAKVAHHLKRDTMKGKHLTSILGPPCNQLELWCPIAFCFFFVLFFFCIVITFFETWWHTCKTTSKTRAHTQSHRRTFHGKVYQWRARVAHHASHPMHPMHTK